MAYGEWCPVCGSPIITVTRGIPSMGICSNNHSTDRRDALHREPTGETKDAIIALLTAQLAERDAAIAAAYEAAAGLVHRIADGYSSGGDKAIACALYLTEGNVRALTPADALAALERVKAEARADVAGLVEALRAIAETSNYTRASWMQDTARAALAAWEGRE